MSICSWKLQYPPLWPPRGDYARSGLESEFWGDLLELFWFFFTFSAKIRKMTHFRRYCVDLLEILQQRRYRCDVRGRVHRSIDSFLLVLALSPSRSWYDSRSGGVRRRDPPLVKSLRSARARWARAARARARCLFVCFFFRVFSFQHFMSFHRSPPGFFVVFFWLFIPAPLHFEIFKISPSNFTPPAPSL